MGTRPSAAGFPPFGATGMARRRSKVIQAPREGAPKSRRPPSTDGGFFLPVHGVRVLKRIFCEASLPKSGNKKPPWLLGGLGFLPGRLPPEWGHGAGAGSRFNRNDYSDMQTTSDIAYVCVNPLHRRGFGEFRHSDTDYRRRRVHENHVSCLNRRKGRPEQGSAHA